MPINGVALGALGIGGMFIYSAIKGKSILATTQAVITGKSPATVGQANPITNVVASQTSGNTTTPMSTVTGIAGIADSYIGKLKYVYGGPPPARSEEHTSELQ